MVCGGASAPLGCGDAGAVPAAPGEAALTAAPDRSVQAQERSEPSEPAAEAGVGVAPVDPEEQGTSELDGAAAAFEPQQQQQHGAAVDPQLLAEQLAVLQQQQGQQDGSFLNLPPQTTNGPAGWGGAGLLMDPSDPKRQICFDFTKGQCSRGNACKFSHNIDLIITVNSREKGICFDFLKGLCARGLLCRFSHDLCNLQAGDAPVRTGALWRAPRLSPPVCRARAVCRSVRYILRQLTRPPTNPPAYPSARPQDLAPRKRFAPVCYDWIKSQCSRGDDCRYSHDYSSILYGPRAPGKDPYVACVDYTRHACCMTPPGGVRPALPLAVPCLARLSFYSLRLLGGGTAAPASAAHIAVA